MCQKSCKIYRGEIILVGRALNILYNSATVLLQIYNVIYDNDKVDTHKIRTCDTSHAA